MLHVKIQEYYVIQSKYNTNVKEYGIQFIMTAIWGGQGIYIRVLIKKNNFKGQYKFLIC